MKLKAYRALAVAVCVELRLSYKVSQLTRCPVQREASAFRNSGDTRKGSSLREIEILEDYRCPCRMSLLSDADRETSRKPHNACTAAAAIATLYMMLVTACQNGTSGMC